MGELDQHERNIKDLSNRFVAWSDQWDGGVSGGDLVGLCGAVAFLLAAERRREPSAPAVSPASSIVEAALSPAGFAATMRALAQNGDQEGRHVEMDRLMADTLRALGYADGVKIFEETPMWHA